MKFLASVLTLAASVALLPAGLAQVSADAAKKCLAAAVAEWEKLKLGQEYQVVDLMKAGE